MEEDIVTHRENYSGEKALELKATTTEEREERYRYPRSFYQGDLNDENH